MKRYILGLITGLLISMSFSVLAALNIVDNPFPVLIDGQEANVQGYNINDSTYLKLRDFEQAGLLIDFQDNTIIVNTTIDVSQIQATKKTPDGIDARIDVKNNRYIVYFSNFTQRYYQTNIELKYNSKTNMYYITIDDEIVVENIKPLDGYYGVDYDYYCNEIIPYIME